MSESARRIAVRINAITPVTPLVKRFRLEPLDGGPLPAFSGGAHVTVEMHDGDVVRRNPYSLMSSPAETAFYDISVRRDDAGRGGSRFMHERLEPGMVLQITYPANLFALDQRAVKHLFVAGGIGITPFIAMIDQLTRANKPFELHYGARSPEHAAYAQELRGRFGSKVSLYYADQGALIPLARLLGDQPLGTHLSICGPDGMIDWARTIARDSGWPDQNVHFERFVAPASGNPYRVMLARSGLTVAVGAHQSMLEAIEAAGVDAPSLCRGGACGQCETTVNQCDGTLLHADHFLSDTEKASGRKVMPCVSRFEGRALVLDL